MRREAYSSSWRRAEDPTPQRRAARLHREAELHAEKRRTRSSRRRPRRPRTQRSTRTRERHLNGKKTRTVRQSRRHQQRAATSTPESQEGGRPEHTSKARPHPAEDHRSTTERIQQSTERRHDEATRRGESRTTEDTTNGVHQSRIQPTTKHGSRARNQLTTRPAKRTTRTTSRRFSEPRTTATTASVTTRRARVRRRAEHHPTAVSRKPQRGVNNHGPPRAGAALQSDVEQPTPTEINAQEEGFEQQQKGVEEWDISRRTAEGKSRARTAGRPRHGRRATRPPSRARQPKVTGGAAMREAGDQRSEDRAERSGNEQRRDAAERPPERSADPHTTPRAATRTRASTAAEAPGPRRDPKEPQSTTTPSDQRQEHAPARQRHNSSEKLRDPRRQEPTPTRRRRARRPQARSENRSDRNKPYTEEAEPKIRGTKNARTSAHWREQPRPSHAEEGETRNSAQPQEPRRPQPESGSSTANRGTRNDRTPRSQSQANTQKRSDDSYVKTTTSQGRWDRRVPEATATTSG